MAAFEDKRNDGARKELPPKRLSTGVEGLDTVLEGGLTRDRVYLLEGSPDAGRLQQIVWNIVSNAIKVTPEGGRVRIATALEGEQMVLRASIAS
jgi:signal transduction histidine kinase